MSQKSEKRSTFYVSGVDCSWFCSRLLRSVYQSSKAWGSGMSKRKRTEITIETDELIFFKRIQHPIFAWCSNCVAKVEMLKPEVVAVIEGVTVRHIFRKVEDGKIYFTETPNGLLLICSKCLLKPP